jgi:hypothetical protein
MSPASTVFSGMYTSPVREGTTLEYGRTDGIVFQVQILLLVLPAILTDFEENTAYEQLGHCSV